MEKYIKRVRVGESSAPRVDALLRSMRKVHGPTMARQARAILRGSLQLAVMAEVLGTNPLRDVSRIESKGRPQGAPGLTGVELRELLVKLQSSEFCQKRDLADPIIVLIGTGIRRSALLGLEWSGFSQKSATLKIAGKVVRVAGKGLVRVDETKTDAGRRTIPLPKFVVDVLAARRAKPYIGEQNIIFPSSTGGLRDPDNFNGQGGRHVRSWACQMCPATASGSLWPR
jgi:integrase